MIVCFVLLGSVAIAQNLVVDPSFEALKGCPRNLSNFNFDLKYWSTPTRGTTDYFHTCGERMGIPNNFNGFQRAKSGNGYAGLYLFAPQDYREYIQAQLQDTLVKGEKYTISFYVSLAEGSDYALYELGVLFTEKNLSLPTDKNLSRAQLGKIRDQSYYLVEIEKKGSFSDSKKWTKVSTEITAKGGERYITIGNFKDNARSGRVKPKNIGPKPKRKQKGEVAYYYIDMMEVRSVNEVVAQNNPQPYTLDKTHVFQNLLFGFDNFHLLDSSMADVQHVYEYLRENTVLSITINGHTDSIGTVPYNLTLSNNRARAVADCLLKLGLPKERIVWQGHGGKKPIATNTTKEGRQQNRRVEFVISEKKQIQKP